MKNTALPTLLEPRLREKVASVAAVIELQSILENTNTLSVLADVDTIVARPIDVLGGATMFVAEVRFTELLSVTITAASCLGRAL